MKLDFQAIHVYSRCPILYLMQYHYGIVPEVSTAYEYGNTLRNVIYHYFFRLLDKQHETEESMRARWYKQWDSKLDKMKLFMGTDSPEKLSSNDRKAQGAKALLDFHRKMQEDISDSIILAVGHDFEITVGDYIVKDSIDVIREVEDPITRKKIVEMIFLHTGQYNVTDWELANNFRISLHSYAFRKIFETMEQRIMFYNLSKGTIEYAKRTAEDYSRLENYVNIVGRCIEANLFFPRQTFACRSCEQSFYCSQWGTK